MTWLHYSPSDTLTLDRAKVYDRKKSFKPDGFWVSAGNAWREWREGESWGIPPVEFAYEVTLREAANLLVLDGAGVRSLHRRFPRQDEPRFHANYPDWKAIRRDFDGILIPEYHWDSRLTVEWYYGWDCASGCIWNLDAIVDLTRRESLVTA